MLSKTDSKTSSVKVLEKRKLSDFEYFVKLKYKGKEYQDNFSLPGLKKLVAEIEDKKSKQYIIVKAMINAVDKPITTKTVGGSNVSKTYQE